MEVIRQLLFSVGLSFTLEEVVRRRLYEEQYENPDNKCLISGRGQASLAFRIS